MPEATLAELQGWVTLVLSSRGDLRQKLARAVERYGLGADDVITSRRAPHPERRLDVYAAAYVLRLVECLAEEFPALRNFLGPSVFETFARAYILERPPSSRSLFDLGRGFPTFLTDTAPPRELVPAAQRAWLGVPAALARLERTLHEVSRARGLEGRDAGPSPSLVSLLSGDIELCAAPCLRLLELDYTLLDFHAALERGEAAPPPSLGPQYVAVSRADYHVTRTALEPWQHRLLEACSARGEGPARSGSRPDRAAQLASIELGTLLAWLPSAVALGLIEVAAATE